MSGFPGSRTGPVLRPPHDPTQFKAEFILSQEGTMMDVVRHPVQAEAHPKERRDFFRYSNRQFMVLISTLSLCFAVNRQNNIDDLFFVLKSVSQFVLESIVEPDVLKALLLFLIMGLVGIALQKFLRKLTAR